jgi:molybdenum cofactor guanylyltransferase
VTKFSSAVLAGGKSKRFGSDKARFVYKDKTLMQWVINSFETATECFIIANQNYEEFGLPVYADIISSPTPLSGIHSALVHAKYDWVAVAACDMPFLTRAFWQTLQAQCNNTNAVVVESDYGLEPLAAFYHRDLAPRIETNLQQNQKAIHVFLRGVDTKILKATELNLSANTFHNINRLEDVRGIGYGVL